VLESLAVVVDDFRLAVVVDDSTTMPDD